LQFRSLRQLILLSFILVLLPLLGLLLHNQYVLSNMGELATKDTKFSIQLTGRMQQMEDTAADLERVRRQYMIIPSHELLHLSRRYATQLSEQNSQVCALLSLMQTCPEFPKPALALSMPEVDVESQLSEARQGIRQLKNATRSALQQKLGQQQSYIQQVQQQQLWFTLVLILLSLFLALYAGGLISKPVKKIELMINELSDNQHKLSAISASGPQELIALESKLHLLAKRLKQLEQLRQTMLRHAAHELKTPLASIKEGCCLLDEQLIGRLNSQQTEVVELLNSSCLRLENLIGQLLNYNALLQQSQPSYDKLDCGQFFGDFIRQNQLALKQHGHQLCLNVEPECLWVDAVLLRRMLDNLLSNSLAYGRLQSDIVLTLQPLDGHYVLQFANQGNKVSLEQGLELFQPFQRGKLKRHDRVEGTGLGLSIVAECAALMGGSAGFVEVDYADVCIEIRLPIYPMGKV